MISTVEQKKEAHAFYKEALTLLNESGAEYMLGGAFAMFHYTGIYRDTKDLDVFCKYAEFPKIMAFFKERGFRTELTDARWLAKIFHGEYYIDIIFHSPNAICLIDDTWYQRATQSVLEGVDTLLIPAEELLWCKIYVHNRERYDGADVNHLILKWGEKLNWKHVLMRMDHHWHLLLAQILNFQFVYPADYQRCIPKWLFDELMQRGHDQYELPCQVEKVCRGPLIDQTQYSIDVKDWDYKAMTIKTI